MLKQGIATAALLAATSSIYAGGPEAPPPPTFIGGAYVDVGLSRDDIYDRFRRSMSTSTTILDGITTVSTMPTTYSLDAGAPGFDGFVGLGYSHVWANQWALGAEIFGDVSSANGTQFERSGVNAITGETAANYLNLRAKYSFGVSLMPGYFVAPGSLYFLELGYVNTAFKLTGFPVPAAGNLGNNAALGNDALDSSWFSANPNRRVNQSGFRVGFGTNTQVGSHVAVREEYVWESYGSFSASRNFTNLPSEGLATTGVDNTVKVSPNISKFNLAAVYYFARQGNAPDLNTAPAHVGGNFYAGLNGSYDEFYSHADFWQHRILSSNDISHLVVSDRRISESALMKGTGWNAGLLAGYGWNFSNRWYLGAELFGNYDDVSGRFSWANGSTTTRTTNGGITTIDISNASVASITSRLEKEWDFGAALIPGYQVSDQALLYARVGYVGADFNIRNNWSRLTGLSAAQNALLTRSRSRWLNGLQLGIGVDTLVYENLSLRTEFNINNYGNYNLDTLVNSTNANGLSTATTVSTRHRHIIEDQFNVALIWHFFA